MATSSIVECLAIVSTFSIAHDGMTFGFTLYMDVPLVGYLHTTSLWQVRVGVTTNSITTTTETWMSACSITSTTSVGFTTTSTTTTYCMHLRFDTYDSTVTALGRNGETAALRLASTLTFRACLKSVLSGRQWGVLEPWVTRYRS